MKCKSWSNKINNFVVRRLKSIKINGPQSQTAAATNQTSQPQQPQQPLLLETPQQHLSTCTMPAMPKEKTTAVSLNENNFTELKFKELTNKIVDGSTDTGLSHCSSCKCGAITTDGASGCNVSSLRHNVYISNGHETSQCCVNIAASANSISSTSQTHQTDITKCSHHLQQNGGSSKHNQNNKNDNGNSGQQKLPMALTNRISNDPAIISTALTLPPMASSSTSSVRASNAVVASTVSTSTTAKTSQSPAVATPPKKSPKDYMFGKYIGEGSYSVVYLAVELATKREYAIKVCEKSHILREHKQEYIRREREVMHMMNNIPGFVNLSCTFQDNRSLYFVMTYAKNGDMLPYINKVGSFDVDCTRHYAAELVLACEQMHRCNIVHRDLKPENILLDEDMHTLIADFGSAKILKPGEIDVDSASTCSSVASVFAVPTASATSASRAGSSMHRSRAHSRNNADDADADADEDDTNDTGSDDVDSPSRQPRYHRRRKGSFVGTAQYVSPEVLQNGVITSAADLWALGCIIYQMIAGLPPFRGSHDYVIFRHILSGKLEFPDGFDRDAEDLVRKLLKLNPEERLGAREKDGCYSSIRSHPFFNGVDIDTVRQRKPPPIYPYLPGVSDADDSDFLMTAHFQPGLDDEQRTRLLGIKLGTAMGYCGEQNGTTEKKKKTATKNSFDLTETEKQKRLEQQKSDIWHVFADNEVILKKGFVNKRKGLFARKRMLLLTTGPRLIYIDPVHMVKKGEIPWSSELRADPKNFKIFFINTPNRTYYLEDPDGNSPDWVEAIEKMAELTYGDRASRAAAALPSATQSPASAGPLAANQNLTTSLLSKQTSGINSYALVTSEGSSAGLAAPNLNDDASKLTQTTTKTSSN